MANLYDLKKFDLNLLVIFECIYQHLSISKAAETLYITPSAVSQSLQRLRTQLNDPLFIRSGKGITPTTVGINLHHHLEENLNQIEQTINILNSAQIKKSFVVYCPQIMVRGRLADLLNTLLADDNYQVEQNDMVLSPESAEDLLAYRKADLVFTFAPINNRSVVCTHFSRFSVVLTCRSNHPRLKDHATPEDLRHEKFTLLRSQENGIKEFQSLSNTLLAERNICFRSDSLISIMNILSSTDLVGYIPDAMFERYKETLNLKSISTSFKMPEIDIYLNYNRAALNSTIFSQFIEKVSAG
ncbi:LysR family transcriptional regulator [Enterobacter quasiroggenkampii]|uniref:DNA-binding transcriptional repressor CitR n=1 Tax=Enterobacter quasiroggenkampii TaxID=2497436 RepID=UPI002DC05DE7|nr:LysR family transcriptional regulator [Enterobacter quasiroggenkampii]MEB7932911.1 LysR family transcriptional regulator [Enterobacter quasiroggenkampii]